ncbi:MAG TPA: MMPL family transporter [Acidimicrobiales bacterium]|nr:MMPL family transporter [Acidimicrobiales bacterium]
MFTRFAHLTVRRRRRILLLTVAFLAVAGFIGTGVFERLRGGGFEDPSAESTQAARLLEDAFGQGDPNVVLLATAKGGNVDDPSVAQAAIELTERLGQEPGVAQALSYWTLGRPPPLKSEAGDKALVLARLEGSEAEVEERIAAISEAYTTAAGPLSVQVGGAAEVFRQIGETIEGDLARAESIAVPVTLVLLVVVFGSVVAASLPLAVGAVAVLGTFLTLYVLTAFTEVSIFSINLTTALGLGLAIDYSLFVVSRFREELRAGLEPHAAVVRTVETAGRTVAFSALTVAVSLSALLVFPMFFLRSFAYAGIAVVIVAAVASVVSLPSLLAVLGHNVDRGRLRRRRQAVPGQGWWHRVATFVMRRPVPIATAVIVVLLVLGSPFLGVRFGSADDRVLPAESTSRAVSEQLRRDFAANETEAFPVVAADAGAGADLAVKVGGYASALSRLDGAARVDALTGSYVDGALVAPSNPGSARFRGGEGTWLSVVPEVDAISPEGEELVSQIRSLEAPFEVAVGGSAAELVDSKEAILGRVPLAAGIVAVTTAVLLFLMFGSVLVPAKAIVLNLLSLTATFGAMVWVFQDGNASDLLDFTATGTLDTTTPILMFCIAFGLSMDYEVFLLSRIKEEYDRTGDNTASVATGLERTGRIVTTAAALLSVTFLAFSTSGVTIIKLFGLGLTMAVVMDATLIRATLVPAFMRLAGEANWWAPPFLRRLHRRFGLSETGPGPRRADGVTVAVPGVSTR